MSLGTCIPGMVKRGEIDPVRAKRMSELFTELERHYARSMGPDAAAAEASEQTLKQLAAEGRLKRRQTLLQIARQADAMKDLERFAGKDKYAAVRALIDDDDRAPYRRGNVTTAATRIDFGVQGMISEFIERHRRNLLGKPKDAEGLDDIVRELHGQKTGNVTASTGADALREAFEYLRQRFNQAGGNIRKLEGYGLTHRHDAMKVRGVSRDQWISDTVPLLDRARMIDERTGLAMTDARLTEALSDVYATIRTNGLTGKASAALRGPGKLANQRSESRFLHFRDGDAWLDYDEKYGAGDNPFTTIMGHISGLSKDIAMMERLGPNPDATMRYMLDHVDRVEAQSDKKIVGAVMGLSGGRKGTEDLWRYVKGDSTVPVLPENRIAYHALRGVQGTRNLLTGAMLGSAPLSAISDINTGLLARGFYGIPATKVLTGYLKQLNPLSAVDRKLAVRLGAGMSDASHSMASIARYYGEAQGPGWTQVVADSVLRVSGLNKITEAGQNAFVNDLLGSLGDVRDKPWDALPEGLRTAMERNGLDKFDWTAIRQAPPIVSRGASYIDPKAIMDPAAADRLMDMVLRGRAAAVQETTASSRVHTTLGTNPGTLGGEVLRNSLQFKGFAVALLMKQGRMISMMGPVGGAVYAAQFVIGMTMFGAATIQLREIVKGRDPRPMDDAEFWGDALFQGGGLGIVGDLVGVFKNDRIDNSMGQFLGGPVASFAVDLVKAGYSSVAGDVREDGTQRPGNPGGAALRLAKRYTPGTSLWYARAAFERMIIDQLDGEINPDHEMEMGRQLGTAKKNKQGHWWAPDSMSPERAPDVANALGGDQPN